jgi:UDP-N-acetylmuramoyl-L-alanyl-D-glutamate--2,6-diaminopimelate ligase
MAMTVGELLNGVNVPEKLASKEITGITTDSRLVEPGDIFAAIKGSNYDARLFAEDAVKRGAIVVIADVNEPLPRGLMKNVPWILAGDVAGTAFDAATSLYSNDVRELAIIGVTGTNGKTSTTFLAKSILDAAGTPTGILGTVRYVMGPSPKDVIKAPLTTPQAVEVHRFLAKMRRNGLSAAVMEVSSQGLDMGRVDGIPFKGAVFTNLSRDHLDYHQTMERYLDAKLALFRRLEPDGFAVVNVDDPHANNVFESTTARKVGVSLFASGEKHPMVPSVTENLVEGELLEESAAGIRMKIAWWQGEPFEVFSPLVGRFNARNVLAAMGVGFAMGIGPDIIQTALKAGVRVPGRMERVEQGQPFLVVVDFAHTPDGLEKALEAARRVTKKKLIVVFGCGGDRDSGKRPQMGNIAARLADMVVVTSDNPRSEVPGKIIEQIVAGIPADKKPFVEEDRKIAIRIALKKAHKGDTVVIAGKGHEDYQILGSKRIHFDDVEEAQTALKELGFQGA